MLISIRRALVAAVVGALAGAVWFTIAFMRDPVLVLEMSQDLPRMTSGFYPVEITPDEHFAWTSRSAALRLRGIDRRGPWECSVRLRGGGPSPARPVVDIGVDGMTLASRSAPVAYEEMTVTAPPRPSRDALLLTIGTSATFVPGPSDTRQLGVQVDRILCRPVGGGVRPPSQAIITAGISGGAFGAAFGLIGLPTAAAAAGAIAIAGIQARPLALGPAPYHPYQERIAWVAVWIAGILALTVCGLERVRRQPLHPAGRWALAFSCAALFIELIALLHPLKAVVDAVFHAHRLEWVLSGRYFFTQPMPNGVSFPYAIGLYVVSAPWTRVAEDHVMLLRIVVSGTHALAGVLLYPMIVRAWNDRIAGLIAVVLFHLVPVPYVTIGNANLTYAFGQSVAFITVAAAAIWPLRARDLGSSAALLVLCALAFLSHVGVFPLLLTTLLAMGVLYWWRGRSALRAPAAAVLAASVLAAVFSVVVYYGQFSESYESLRRARGRATGSVAAHGQQDDAASRGSPPSEAVPRHRRLIRALTLAVIDLGWPILLLGMIGAWRVWSGDGRDRLGMVLAAMAAAYLLFVVAAVVSPVEPRFQRYADEFISRVDYGTIPLAVILAARGASWGWRTSLVTRCASAVLLLAAVVVGADHWVEWLR